jgi:hypothetical protein
MGVQYSTSYALGKVILSECYSTKEEEDIVDERGNNLWRKEAFFDKYEQDIELEYDSKAEIYVEKQ